MVEPQRGNSQLETACFCLVGRKPTNDAFVLDFNCNYPEW